MMDYMCRTCLATYGELVPIFSDEYYVRNLPMKLMKTTKIKISENDSMPKMMCKKCIFLVDSLYCFKDQCEMADLKLKKSVQDQVLDDTIGSLNISLPTLMDEQMFNDILGLNSSKRAPPTPKHKHNLSTERYDIENECPNDTLNRRTNTRNKSLDDNSESEALKNSSHKNVKFYAQNNEELMDVDNGSYQEFVKNDSFQQVLHSSLKDGKDECDNIQSTDDPINENSSDEDYVVEYVSEEARLEVENAQRKKARESIPLNSQRSKGVKVVSVEILPSPGGGNVLENYVLAAKQSKMVNDKLQNYKEPSDDSDDCGNDAEQDSVMSSTRKQLTSLLAAQKRRTQATKKKLSYIQKRRKNKVKRLTSPQKVEYMKLFPLTPKNEAVEESIKDENSENEKIKRIEEEFLNIANNEEANDAIEDDDRNEYLPMASPETNKILNVNENSTKAQKTLPKANNTLKRKMSKSDEDLEKMLSEDITKENLVINEMEENAPSNFLKQIESKYPYKCQKCNELQSFKTFAELISHSTTCSKEQSHPCSVCRKIFNNTTALQNHTCSRSTAKLFQCPMCSENFVSERRLSVHLYVHIDDEKKCKLCETQFQADSALHEHYCFHAGVSSHWCNLLESTIKKYQEKDFKNVKIPQNIPVEHSTNKTERTVQSKSATFQNLFSEQELPKHLLEHSKSPFLCPYCDKAFEQQPVLIDHVYLHLGVEQFTCLACEEIFETNDERMEHMLKHGREDPEPNIFKCNLCDEKFEKESEYLTHQDNHISNEPDQNLFYEEPDIDYLVQEVVVNTEES